MLACASATPGPFFFKESRAPSTSFFRAATCGGTAPPACIIETYIVNLFAHVLIFRALLVDRDVVCQQRGHRGGRVDDHVERLQTEVTKALDDLIERSRSQDTDRMARVVEITKALIRYIDLLHKVVQDVDVGVVRGQL